MKKYILCCIAALCSTFEMAADNISVQYEQVVRGETVTLSVNLNNSSSNQYVGFQMDLTLPAGFTLNKAGCSLGSRINDSSQELTIGKQGDNVYRLFSTSMNLTPISGNSGELLRLSLNTTRSTENGVLKISNIQFATNTSQRVAMSNIQLNLNFKKESQTLALASLPDMTYGDANYTLPTKTNEDFILSWTSSNTSVVAVSNGQLVVKGAGSTTVTASNSGSDYYNAFSKSYSVTVSKAPLTIKAGNYTKKQGEAMPTMTPTFEGFKNSETKSVLTKQPTISCVVRVNSVPGEYAVTVSGAQAKNYAITYVNGTFTVTQADPVTLTARSYTRSYGGANPNFSFDVSGETFGGEPIIECAATKNSPVGTYPIVIKQGSVVNTNAQYVNGTLTITKAPMTIKAGDYTKKQGEAMPTFTPIFSGFKNYETKSVLTRQPTISCEATVNSVPGEYAVNISGAEAQNYEITHINGKLTVTNADPVTLTARSYTREYGEANPGFAFDVNGATLGGQPVIECSATKDSPVGTYPIVIKQGSVVNTNGQYVNGMLTITKAPLTIKAGDYTKKQGEAMPQFVPTFEGFKNNETCDVLSKQPTISCEATANSVPGEYAVTVSGAEAQNYEITHVNGKLTVTNADLVTLTARSYTREYGEDNPDFGFDVSGATLGGEPIIECAATKDSPVDTYPIVIRQGSVVNTNGQYVNGILTITKAPLTIRAGNYTKRQGEEMPTIAPTFEGFKNGETKSVLTKQPTISCEVRVNSVPGEYAVTVSGAQATNYAITYINGTFTVTQADPVTITARSYTRAYGGANPNFAFDINGETLGGTPVIECTATEYSPVGTYPIVIRQGSVVNTNGQYVNGTLTITKAPLTIKAGDYTKKQGDGMPTFTPIFSGFKNYENKSVLTRQPTISCEATVNSVPGEYAVTISGAEAQNYEITHVNGKLTVTNADTVTLTARSYTREYGENNPDFAYVVSGETFGGTPVIECEATANSPVGTYPIVIRQGSVVNTNTSFINGTLTITKAPLTVSAGEYTMERGEALPEFVLSYEGFKNGEGVEVLTKQPVATCEGDGTEAGEFEITVGGGEAENYAFVYKPGKLTVTDIHAVRNVLSCNELQTYAGYEQRTLEVCLTNADEVTLCQFDLHLPKDVSVATKASGSLDITMTSRGRKHSVTGQQQDDGSYRILTTSMTDNSFIDHEGVLMTIRLNLPKDIAVGEHEVLLDNIELSLPIEGNNLLVVRPADQRSKIVVLAHTPGDVNEDGKVSVTDAGYAVKYILELTPSVFCFAAADMNKDDLVTVTDVGCIVNTILGRPVLMRRAVRREAVQGTDQLTVEPVRMKAGERVELAVAMDNAVTNYMGWQCDMTLADGLTLTSGEDGYPEAVLGSRFQDTDHQIGANVRAAGGYRFIASSFDGNTIPGHSGTLFTVTLQAGDTMAAGTYEGKLTNIEFNTTDNQRILFGDLTFTVTVEPEGIKGDVNKDGAVDIADVVAVYNIMAVNNPNGLNGDVNEDGATDIADVVAIYNIMAGR